MPAPAHALPPARLRNRRAWAAELTAGLLCLAPTAFLASGASAQGTAPAGKKPAPAPAGLAFELITPGEAKRNREARPKNDAPDPAEARTRGLTGAAPSRSALVIRVIAPTPQAAVAAPLRIELAFEAPPGAQVVPSTFRILYGVLKIDLTERLRRFATISERGVVVEQAVVPEGLHRLFLQVADDKGNVAEQEMRLRVGVAS